MIRLSVTARIALLAFGSALACGLMLVAFFWQQTRGNAIEELRRDTVEQAKTLHSVWRANGRAALVQAIAQSDADDDDTAIAELVDRSGNRVEGVGPQHIGPPVAGGFRIAVLGKSPPWSQVESGFVVWRVGNEWLVTGWQLDAGQQLSRTIERALGLAILLAVGMGIAAGVIVARYVTGRVDRIADVVDAVSAGDMDRRVGSHGKRDAFDRLGRRIDFMLDRIDRLVRELRLVTDSIAHDLRSPLQRLRGRAEAALAATDPERRDAALAGLIGETDLVIRMLSTLLEISRTEAADSATLPPVEPGPLVEAVAELFEPVVEEAGMAFTVDLPDPPPAAMPLHRELLSLALSNLIDNAIRHARAGGSVSLSLIEQPGGIALSVADRGEGIAPEQQALARSAFGRLDRARSVPGAGLGLALVEAVARLHGGALRLEDNGPGLIARIDLPCSQRISDSPG